MTAFNFNNDIEASSFSFKAEIFNNKTSTSVIDHQNDQNAVTLKTRNDKQRKMNSIFRASTERKKIAAFSFDVEKSNIFTQSTKHFCTDQRSQFFFCKCTLINRKIFISIEIWKKYILNEIIKLLMSTIDANFVTEVRVCHVHWCKMTSHLKMKANIDDRQMNNFELTFRLRKMHKKKNNFDVLRVQNFTRYWWQSNARFQRDEIKLNVFRLKFVEFVNFMLNEENRHFYLSEKIEQRFKIKRTVIMFVIFEWLLKNAKTWFYFKNEVNMYRYHQIFDDDLKRNCWHFLLQQIVRSNSIYYRFTILLQFDHEHRLIVYLDCMLFAIFDDQNQLRHIKFNIRDLSRNQEINQIFNLISFINEKKKKCEFTFCKIDDARFTLNHSTHDIEEFSLCERITASSTFLKISRYDAIIANNENKNLFEMTKIYKNFIASRQWVREFSNVHKIIFERFFVVAEISQIFVIDETLINKRFYEFFIVIAKLQILFDSNKTTSNDWIRHNRQTIKKNIKTTYDIVKNTKMKIFDEKSYWFRKMNNMSFVFDDDDESINNLRQYVFIFFSHRDLKREHTRSRSKNMFFDILLIDFSLLSNFFF